MLVAMAGAQRLTGGRADGRAVGRGGASRRLRRCLRAVQAQAAEWAQKLSERHFGAFPSPSRRMGPLQEARSYAPGAEVRGFGAEVRGFGARVRDCGRPKD